MKEDICKTCGGIHCDDCGINQPPASQSELIRPLCAMPEEPTDEQLADACMWSRHDFGLMSKEQKGREMFAMRECWRAIWKAINTPGRGAEFL